MRQGCGWCVAYAFVAALFMGERAAAEQAAPPTPFDRTKAEEAARVSDPAQATHAYLESVPAERVARTKAYAAESYALTGIGFLYAVLVLAGILLSGLSAGLRNFANRMVRWRWLQTALYALLFIVVYWVATLPLTFYESYVHPKRFGLLHQSLAGWLRDQLVGLAILLVLGSLIVVVLYAVLRRAPRTWWLWGWAVLMVFLVIGMAIAPVYLMPLFNKFTSLPESELRTQILTLAREHQVPANDVYVMDQSTRSNNIGAYVAGMLGSTRIVLLDTLLARCRPDEVLFVMGHEMGHYVLNHIWKSVGLAGAAFLFGFLFVRWAFDRLVVRWPGAGIQGVGDPAGLPLFLLLFTVFLFVLMPLANTWSRVQEAQADGFGLDASALPDAAARDFLMLGEYRDLDPHPLVEALLFDHPAGRNRIRHAMDWKAAHPNARPPVLSTIEPGRR